MEPTCQDKCHIPDPHNHGFKDNAQDKTVRYVSIMTIKDTIRVICPEVEGFEGSGMQDAVRDQNPV